MSSAIELGDPPVFIGGVNRSGTSLLRRLVGSHSEIAMPPTEFGFFEKLPKQDPDEGREAFLDLIREVLSWRKVEGWDLDEKAVLQRASEVPATRRSLFLLVLDAYRRRLGKPRLGEKTTHYERHLETLDDWFDDNYVFLHMVRNPVDTYASQLWYQGKRRDIPVAPWAEAWTSSVRRGIRRTVSRPRRHRIVRFEDLVDDTEDVLQRLCESLNVPYEPERMLGMVDFDHEENSSFEDERDDARYEGKVRKSDAVDRRSKIPDDDLDVLRSLCQREAELLGYKLEGPEESSEVKAALDAVPWTEAVRTTAASLEGRIRRRLL